MELLKQNINVLPKYYGINQTDSTGNLAEKYIAKITMLLKTKSIKKVFKNTITDLYTIRTEALTQMPNLVNEISVNAVDRSISSIYSSTKQNKLISEMYSTIVHILTSFTKITSEFKINEAQQKESLPTFEELMNIDQSSPDFLQRKIIKQYTIYSLKFDFLLTVIELIKTGKIEFSKKKQAKAFRKLRFAFENYVAYADTLGIWEIEQNKIPLSYNNVSIVKGLLQSNLGIYSQLNNKDAFEKIRTNLNQ